MSKYEKSPEIEMTVADTHRVIFTGTVNWPWKDALPRIGESLLMGDDVWYLTVTGIRWSMDPASPVIVIDTTIDSVQRHYDEAFVQNALTESGLL